MVDGTAERETGSAQFLRAVGENRGKSGGWTFQQLSHQIGVEGPGPMDVVGDQQQRLRRFAQPGEVPGEGGGVTVKALPEDGAGAGGCPAFGC